MNADLQGFIRAAEAAAVDAEKLFGGLNETQLNWKPSVDRWSVGQCLDHLIVTNELEFPAIEAALGENYQNPLWSRIEFLPAFFGKYVLKAVQPENKKPWQAPKSFRPTQSAVDKEIVKKFVANQAKFIGLMRAGEHLDLTRTKIVSPISRVVTYSLWYAYKILVTHERRHFGQAERVMQNPNFPQ